MKSFYQQNRYKIYILFMWLLAFVIVYPVCEFAINDDWAYAKNVYNFVVNGKFVVDEWPAMNLISQTLYGTIITGIFGFSFTTLRISIFLLSACSSLFLFHIVNKLSSKNNFIAFTFTAVFVFNALYLHLSMTYMTDVFFVSMLIFALHALINYHTTLKISSYIWFCCWCVVAMLCRQQALVFALLIIPPVLKQNKPAWIKFAMSMLPVFLCWLASDKYRHHLTANHIGHNLQQMHHLLDYLKEAPLEKHALQAADLLLVIGGILIPISVFLFLTSLSQFKRKEFFLLLFTSLIAVVCTVPAFGIYPIGNISEMLEIGPRLIKEGGEEIQGETAKILHVLNYVFAVASLSLILFFTIKKSKSSALLHANRIAQATYFLVLFTYFVFVSVSNAYFDRYSLTLVLLTIIFLVPDQARVSALAKYITTAVIFIVFLSSTIENRDYFNWQKKRSEAIRYLYKKGVSANEIDGGFEFNGWVKKNNAYPSDTKKSWWWVVDDKYMVSAKTINGRRVDTSFIYQRIIPFKKDTVYLLIRE